MDRKTQLLNIASHITEDPNAIAVYAEHLDELFEIIIPDKIGNDFAEAVRQGDYTSAVALLAAHFRSKPANPVPELSCHGEYSIEQADSYVSGSVCTVNIPWSFDGGKINYLFNPTEISGPVNHEWLWQFNRHNEWRNMARAYTAEGDERYARSFSECLLNWIATAYIPQYWNDSGSAWRTIECGIRLLGSWQVAFDGFRKSPELCDTTLLLMISSMHRQAVHLREHPTKRNWLMMESNGLYTFSALFTELSDSEENRRIATERLCTELSEQILPDGMHNELSPDYQAVVLDCACAFYSIAMALGLQNEIPECFTELIGRTVNAAMLLSTPAFTQPRTNDCYTIFTDRFIDKAISIFGESEEYKFFRTKRAEGKAPSGQTASAYLPYAGFAVMRSGWDADASYLCFDTGTLGMAHAHQDKLNINIYKGSHELIFDDGGGQYDISAARDYAISGYGHNTVLVDGLAQLRKEPKQTDTPIDIGWVSNELFDYASATYDDTFGTQMVKPALHKREIRFCKPDVFVVRDTLSSRDGAPHNYELLLHLDTTEVNVVEGCKNAAISNLDGEYEIAIIPLDDDTAPVKLNVASGVTEPRMQGWFNGRNAENLHPATTVSRCVEAAHDFTFTTLLIPIRAQDGIPDVVKNGNGSFTVNVNGREYTVNPAELNK